MYKYTIFQNVSSKHLFTQYQSFIAVIDFVRILSSDEEALKCKNWTPLIITRQRLVTKGCTYAYDIDYKEAIVQVAKMNTVRISLSLDVFGIRITTI